METASTFETSVNLYQTTRRNIPEDSHLQVGFSSGRSLKNCYRIGGDNDMQTSGDPVRPLTDTCHFGSARSQSDRRPALTSGLTPRKAPSSPEYKSVMLLLHQWFPKCGARPPGGVQEILKGGARGVKLFYSLKINKKNTITIRKIFVLLDVLLSKITLFMFHI
jgi:hypothetical protein